MGAEAVGEGIDRLFKTLIVLAIVGTALGLGVGFLLAWWLL